MTGINRKSRMSESSYLAEGSGNPVNVHAYLGILPILMLFLRFAAVPKVSSDNTQRTFAKSFPQMICKLGKLPLHLVLRFLRWLVRIGRGLLRFFSIRSVEVWDKHHSIIDKHFRDSGFIGKAVIIVTYFVMAPFHETFFSLTNNPRPPLSQTQVSSFERIGGLEPPHFFDRIVAYIAAMVFGAIHCIAWSFAFPSNVEKIFWRSSSLVVTCIPILVAFGEVLMREYQWSYRIKRAIFTLLILGPAVFYIPARFALLVQGFLALRDLPAGAFESVQWTLLIPHI